MSEKFIIPREIITNKAQTDDSSSSFVIRNHLGLEGGLMKIAYILLKN
jgi:hypothetical protein